MEVSARFKSVDPLASHSTTGTSVCLHSTIKTSVCLQDSTTGASVRLQDSTTGTSVCLQEAILPDLTEGACRVVVQMSILAQIRQLVLYYY